MRSVVEESKWQDARQLVLARDKHQCKQCGERSRLHVHHLLPRSLGGPDEPSNLITLCDGCHAVRHPTLQAALSRTTIEKWALWLARLLDSKHEIPEEIESLKLGLRLFGKESFRDGQLEVILAALRGESMLVVRPTGSGKSLCFQLPGLLKSGACFVLSPLKALMSDQVAALQETKIPASFINSDLSTDEKEARYGLMEGNALKFLYLTPERFDASSVRDPGEIERICRIRPSYLVVDEAHCIDRWGRDFRPSYGRLSEVRKQLGSPPVLAFTATAGQKAQQRIIRSLGIMNARVFCADIDRPNISLVRLLNRTDAERYRITANLIRKSDGKSMIFVPTLKVGEQVRDGLRSLGVSIPFYHGRLENIERDQLLCQFTGRTKLELNAIICTNAFGMGIDVPNVRLVVHWVQPESVEDYLQEFGRAGRDGGDAVAVIFKNRGDDGLRRFMAEKSTGEAGQQGKREESALETRLESIRDLDSILLNTRRCFRKQLLQYFEGTAPRPGQSWAMRIIQWLFSEKQRVTRAGLCCDACNPKEIGRLLR